MPFLVEVDCAAARIVRAIRRRKDILRFPWPMLLMIRIIGLVPKGLTRWVTRRKAGKIVLR